MSVDKDKVPPLTESTDPETDGTIYLSARQQEVLKLVRNRGFAGVEELARTFEMTPQTIRRDINALCEIGLLRRHHGGAGLPSSVENADYQHRQIHQHAEKRDIADLVATHVPPNSSLIINIGTTTEEVARALRMHEGLRVITNNLNVATILAGNSGAEVIIAGGVVRPRDRGITGEATIDFIKQFKVDIAIIGISGIDTDDGALLDFDYHEVRVAQAILQSAREVFLVADHTKFGRNALVRLGDFSHIDALFTDRRPSDAFCKVLESCETKLHVAGGSTGA